MKMIKREVVESVTLVRDGKRVCLSTGQKFDFTEEEVEQINAASPKALSATSVVDLDTGDADLKKQGDDAPLVPAKKAAGKKAAESTDL
jgi:hypothetical protein